MGKHSKPSVPPGHPHPLVLLLDRPSREASLPSFQRYLLSTYYVLGLCQVLGCSYRALNLGACVSEWGTYNKGHTHEQGRFGACQCQEAYGAGDMRDRSDQGRGGVVLPPSIGVVRDDPLGSQSFEPRLERGERDSNANASATLQRQGGRIK